MSSAKRKKAPLEPCRFSRLKLMGKSAAHFEHGFGEETSAMRKGSGTHAYLLGGEDKVVLYDGGRRDDRIEKWREFKAENDGKHILIPSELEQVEGMRRSVERHRRAMTLLDGVQETRITWDIGGRPCAGTPDVVHPKRGRKILVELKTCESSHPDRFMWRGGKMGYHAQVDWYKEGCERTLAYEPGPVEEVYVVAVESTPPWPVTVFRVRERKLEQGRRLWRSWFEQMRVCEDAGRFPAYVEGDVDWDDDEADVELEWGDAAE